ncbi:MAG TPA: TIGR02186 family protein [Hyphomicrobiaceae bacterium]|jgi:uncharacterized protein (TIGR02186 family)
MAWLYRHRGVLTFLGVLAVGLLAPGIGETLAQRRKAPPPVAKEAPGIRQQEIRREQQPGAKESVEADVSARNIAVTSNFNGTEIVVFGAVDGSQQPSAESGYYDLIIVVEGVPSRMVVRRKSNVAGLWLNTSSVIFDNVPSYYAVASNRPIDEIASEDFRTLHGIGLHHIRFTPAVGQSEPLSNEDIKQYRDAVVELKRKARLYVESPFGAGFTGKSLFRASVVLPANVPVGPLLTHVYLFREEKLLYRVSVRHTLGREGLEWYLHAFAYRLPTLYGFTTVGIAVGAGLLASAAFRKTPSG